MIVDTVCPALDGTSVKASSLDFFSVPVCSPVPVQ